MPDRRQQQDADEGGEHHQHGGVAVLEIAIDKVFVDVGGGRP